MGIWYDDQVVLQPGSGSRFHLFIQMEPWSNRRQNVVEIADDDLRLLVTPWPKPSMP